MIGSAVVKEHFKKTTSNPTN